MLAVGVFLVAVAPFLRAWDYGLINLDDYQYLYKYAEIHTWMGWTSVRHCLTAVGDSIWMPLTWLSYCVDWLLFGDWMGGAHLHSIAVHGVNAVLVWCFLRLLFPRRAWLCLVAALFWAIHPLRCESVVFVASRKDVLSFFWEILALICWVRGGTRNTVLATVFFVVGSLCKPSVMTFPVLCGIVDLFVLREVRLRRYVVPVAYMLFLGAFAHWQQAAGGATVDLMGTPLWGRLLNASAAFGIYVRNTVWPQWLALQCVRVWPEMPRFLVPGLAITLCWGGWLACRLLSCWDERNRFFALAKDRWNLPCVLTNRTPATPVFAGALWFAVAVFPMLGIASFGYHAFADRFTYIPSVGLAVLLVAMMERWRILRWAMPAAVSALGLCTWRQTGFWKDDRTAFSHTLEVDGNRNAFAHNALASWYYEFPHDVRRTIDEYEAALEANAMLAIQDLDVYILALGEAGELEKIAPAFRRLSDLGLKSLGEDRYRRAVTQADGLSAKEAEFRHLYLSCRIAWLMADGEGAKQAGELLSSVSQTLIDENAIWLYHAWRIHSAKGDAETAARYLELLRRASPRTGYFRFRHVTGTEAR